ncbi:D-alanine--D-alanine ligase family protein [Paenibacillus sp.]|uniref:D-alanine--D-alanine ligase family protein n=1 Tax=Paenibacillus sp. TaxID=58172 RepID=UPI002811A600|nr:D-alanine--D-alanine ligase family protein [Paenibacillus sp.]
MKKIRIGIIYGGKSGEHEASLSTAKAVIGEIDFDKYEVYPFYITKSGEWRMGAQVLAPVDDKKRLTFEQGGAAGVNAEAWAALFGSPSSGEPQPALPPSAEAAPSAPSSKPVVVSGAPSAAYAAPKVDVAFPLLHGTLGEDGAVQGLLEMLDVPYVGAGVLATAVGMDKVAMKKMFASAGLPQCVYRYFTRKQWERDRSYFLMEIEMSLGYPCFVKPANLGASAGIFKARNREELIEAVREAFSYDRKVIVEEFVDAREIEVSVLGNEAPRASVPGEIVAAAGALDYKAKYADGKSVMTIPADLPLETVQEAQELAVRAFQAIEGSGLSHVDFFLKRDDGKLLVNEIDTLPGLTSFSMYPKLWKESGLAYRELLDELIRLAVERREERRNPKYDTDE